MDATGLDSSSRSSWWALPAGEKTTYLMIHERSSITKSLTRPILPPPADMEFVAVHGRHERQHHAESGGRIVGLHHGVERFGPLLFLQIDRFVLFGVRAFGYFLFGKMYLESDAVELPERQRGNEHPF